MSTTHYRTNAQIQAKEVRLLREDGTQVGVVAREEALSQAKTAGVDAVEIAPLAVPPVVKLIDYKKFQYQLSKKERAAKSTQKKVDLKEIRLTPFMAENDFSVKINRGREFLTDGHKLRVAVKFVGRQLGHKEFGDKIMQRAFQLLSDISAVDQQPKWFGRQYIATLSPIKNAKTKN
ncbi:MAG: Translation initiation factor IF-3 [Candidatus Amesbacteria bacterium GW2011_GWB1_47_26]|uniref:Translation initiation factor IF-3 n=1 Tax=Candidatus Amesbacteria bacterium GW2011_GWC2_45_19 TaxID=1618366 RepID=A0A0G1M4P3_9BACT|nr:MAG: Translation initiation factor IF-3 [Candidatus Amesbacteria bacterium GW2011_GWC2_45_19]KKU38648.1 MAG: Translation initiation factor IF-3 [Candidatus Amesbacteria bacterium GW2011_GWA1_46_35]KKU68647.1 MAG: translation initiation factor IF-3, translation initiation factor IF-3 [Microgenomates group bacterium GW2011_GWC1_47_20]KKU74968.1 MAG: Translation initiation factor IF-3 [Candidatus Amesbacteria bacterium GW2011_GWB1_47_26]KKU80267.1 MAG: Translation initiation factor IF-3 [Candid